MRFVSYNIHSCFGTDRRCDPGRIAAVIASLEADVVALQEVDVARPRSGSVDQAETIGRATGMHHAFFAPLEIGAERYGIAVLTRRPARLVRQGRLPGLLRQPGREPRGAMVLSLDGDGGPVTVANTHFGLARAERLAQATALLSGEWLGGTSDPLVLLGDFNAVPGSQARRLLCAHLGDARAHGGREGRRATFPSRLPLLALDHCFTRGAVEIRRVFVEQGRLARRASDHLPLVIDLDIG